jgi:hypothetical protein
MSKYATAHLRFNVAIVNHHESTRDFAKLFHKVTAGLHAALSNINGVTSVSLERYEASVTYLTRLVVPEKLIEQVIAILQETAGKEVAFDDSVNVRLFPEAGDDPFVVCINEEELTAAPKSDRNESATISFFFGTDLVANTDEEQFKADLAKVSAALGRLIMSKPGMIKYSVARYGMSVEFFPNIATESVQDIVTNACTTVIADTAITEAFPHVRSGENKLNVTRTN